MATRTGITLTPNESEVVTDWQEDRRKQKRGSVGDLAAQLEIDRSTLSRWSNGSRSMSEGYTRAVLGVMRSEDPTHFIRLDVVAGEDLRAVLRKIRHMELAATPTAGRGRCFAVGV